MTKQVNHLINGRRAAGRSECTHAVYNPATGQQSGSLPSTSLERMRFVMPSPLLLRRFQNEPTPHRCVA